MEESWKKGPMHEDVEGAPFKIGQRVEVVKLIDGTPDFEGKYLKDEDTEHMLWLDSDKFCVGVRGTVTHLDYACGCGQSYPDDPMIGVLLDVGIREEFWREELKSVTEKDTKNMEPTKKLLLKDGREMHVFQDQSPTDPRELGELVGTFYHWHQRRNLGVIMDGGANFPVNDEDIALKLAVYLYEHGDISFSLSPFNDRFDSGQVGWYVVTHADVQRIWGTTSKEVIRSAVEAELTELANYCNGNVWGYVIKKKTECSSCKHVDWEDEDSCWGFIGELSDDIFESMIEHLGLTKEDFAGELKV